MARVEQTSVIPAKSSAFSSRVGSVEEEQSAGECGRVPNVFQCCRKDLIKALSRFLLFEIERDTRKSHTISAA
jgi:hypothetical protein